MTEPASIPPSPTSFPEQSTGGGRQRRKRGANTTHMDGRDDCADNLLIRLDAFKQKNHSLRLSASNIAAMSGFHPFKDLPQLFMELVYQGSVGQELFKHDCSILGLTIYSEDDIILQLAQKAGKATSVAVQSAIQVKKGSKTVNTTQDATKLKRTALEEAQRSKKLTKVELKHLEEHVRHSVNTGYGIFHEDEALNMYETQCGWPVKERNEEIMCWPFQKIMNNPRTLGTELPSVVPLRKAAPFYSSFEMTSSTNNGDCSKGNKESKQSKRKKINSSESNRKNKKALLENDDEEKENCEKSLQNDESSHGESEKESNSNNMDEPCKEDSQRESDNVDSSSISTSTNSFKPFFSILGAVDGIREELWCPPSTTSSTTKMDTNPEDEEWTMREIVVECKHRMKRPIHPPPLYDQIQAIAYCLMYGVADADIVQVTRKSTTTTKYHTEKTNNGRQGGDKGRKGNQQQQQQQPKKPKRSSTGKDGKESPGIKTYFSPVNKKEKKESDSNDTKRELPLNLQVDLKEETAIDKSLDKENPEEETNVDKNDNNIVDSKALTKSIVLDDTKGSTNQDNSDTKEKAGDQTSSGEKNDINADGGKPINLIVDLTNEDAIDMGKSEVDKKEAAVSKHAKKNSTKIVINVSRISLDEPIMQHRRNWDEVVLPRLRSFVDAVYKVRGDDAKRYQLLATTSRTDSKDQEEAWAILHSECPWLLNCDTAFFKLS